MFKKCCVLLLFLTSSQVLSHEFLTQMLVASDTLEVSPDYEYSIIETFHLSHEDLDDSLHRRAVRQEIKRIAASRQNNVNPEHVFCDDWNGVFKTCGVFDDFSKARTMAIDMCNGVADAAAELYVDGLIPQFIGPATFTNGTSAAFDHHDAYEFSHGLSFNCVEVISHLATE